MYNRHRSCHRNQPICCPPNVLPTQVAPARVSPTQEVVKTNIINTVVPHVHPTHTTTVNRHITHHQHYFPQTQSVVNEYYENNTNVGGAQDNPMSNPMTRPMSSPMSGPMSNPMTSPMSNSNCYPSCKRRRRFGC